MNLKKNLRILILTAIILVVNIAQADTTQATLPLPSELLNTPIRLECGAVIREWRGSIVNKRLVGSICLQTAREFLPFISDQGYHPRTSSFHYSLSFIPDGSNYRSMNDIEYRFAGRKSSSLTGYTVHEDRYVFNISDTRDPEFRVSLMHELFHAMSYHYGVFAQHPGKKYEKIIVDEYLAKKFTKKVMGQQ